MDDKKFVMPEAEIVDFAAEDIITESLTDAGTAGWDNGFGEDY